MAGHDVIVIGASAGGVEALSQLVAQFPSDLAASLFIVQHTAPDSPGLLAHILDRRGSLRAVIPADGDPIEPGVIYVAPPDRHLLVKPGHVHLTRGPRRCPVLSATARCNAWRTTPSTVTAATWATPIRRNAWRPTRGRLWNGLCGARCA